MDNMDPYDRMGTFARDGYADMRTILNRLQNHFEQLDRIEALLHKQTGEREDFE